MKKKLGAIVLAGMMACLSFGGLVGCGKGGKGKVKDFVMPEGGFDMEKQVEIKFYHTMGQSKQKILADYIEKFNKIYPNIKVDASRVFGKYEDVRDTIVTEIYAGAQPNLAYCYPDHVAMYNEAGAVLPLNDFLPDGDFKDIKVKVAEDKEEPIGYTKEQKEAFFEAYYNEGYQFGDGSTMYTLPLAKSTEVLYYNKKFFDANDLTVPTTWDEMESVCQQIKTIAPTKTPLGYDSEANWFITMCAQLDSPYTSATGEKYRFNNETNRNFVTRFKGWFDKGYVLTSETNNGSYTSGAFTAQDVYMCIGSSAGASYQMPDRETVGGVSTRKFEVGIAPIPQIDKTNPKAISQGPSICIFKDNDPQKVLASWLFSKFLTTSIDFQAEFSFDSGYAPVIKTATENKIYQAGIAAADGFDNLIQTAVKTCMANSNSYFTSPAFVGSSRARDEVGKLMAAVFNGTPVNQAFEDAIYQCNHFAG
ncbi:MAG: extracellular solute-binding protein [Clostridiales bacterium]|nr:extracellular solute-binding protein [Clostridiales bacterium]